MVPPVTATSALIAAGPGVSATSVPQPAVASANVASANVVRSFMDWIPPASMVDVTRLAKVARGIAFSRRYIVKLRSMNVWRGG